MSTISHKTLLLLLVVCLCFGTLAQEYDYDFDALEDDVFVETLAAPSLMTSSRCQLLRGNFICNHWAKFYRELTSVNLPCGKDGLGKCAKQVSNGDTLVEINAVTETYRVLQQSYPHGYERVLLSGKCIKSGVYPLCPEGFVLGRKPFNTCVRKPTYVCNIPDSLPAGTSCRHKVSKIVVGNAIATCPLNNSVLRNGNCEVLSTNPCERTSLQYNINTLTCEGPYACGGTTSRICTYYETPITYF